MAQTVLQLRVVPDVRPGGGWRVTVGDGSEWARCCCAARARGCWPWETQVHEPQQVAAGLDDVGAWARWLEDWRFAAGPVQLEAVRRAVQARPAQGDTVSETLSAPVDRAGEVASHVVGRALGDLDDALFYQLLAGAERAAGLAVWALVGAPGGPAAPLLEVLEDRERAVVARCVTRPGHWPGTIAAALPSLPGSAERALHLQSDPVDAAGVEGWLDLHVALRLVGRWHEPGAPCERQDRAIVVQNRGRSRGRLRAVATRRPAVALTEALWSLEGLADRTVVAARRWAWACAWEALATDFAFDLGQAIVRSCATEAGSEPLDGDDLDALRVWALWVLLRGRFETLERWARTAQGDRDGT